MKEQTKPEDNWLAGIGSALKQLQENASSLEEQVEKSFLTFDCISTQEKVGPEERLKTVTDLFFCLPDLKIFWSVKEEKFLVDIDRSRVKYLDDLYLMLDLNLNRYKKNKAIQKLCAYVVKESREKDSSSHLGVDDLTPYLDQDPSKTLDEIRAEVAKVFLKDTIRPRLLTVYKQLLTDPAPVKNFHWSNLDHGYYNLQSLTVDQIADIFHSDKALKGILNKLFTERRLFDPEYSKYFCKEESLQKMRAGFERYTRLELEYIRGWSSFVELVRQVVKHKNMESETAISIINEIFSESEDGLETLYDYSCIYHRFDGRPEYLFVTESVKNEIREQLRNNKSRFFNRFSRRKDTLSWLLSLVDEDVSSTI